MTFNTGNPIGSTDARDLSDNAENFDVALGTLSPTWVDRLGNTRDSFEGRLAKWSFYRVGTFAAGYTLTNMRQTLEYSGHEYSWAGAFPKVVAAGSTPATSGGIGAGAWVDRTDLTLRAELSSASGTDMINFGGISLTEKLNKTDAKLVYITDYAGYDVDAGLTITNIISDYFSADISSEALRLVFPAGRYPQLTPVNITLPSHKHIEFIFHSGASLRVNNDISAFSFTGDSTNSLHIGGYGSIVANFGINSTTATALKVSGFRFPKSLCIDGAMCIGTTTHDANWKTGFHLVDCDTPVVFGLHLQEASTVSFSTAIKLEAINQQTTDLRFIGVTTGGHKYWLEAYNHRTGEGLEGIQFIDCSFVGGYAIIQNLVAPATYAPPQVWFKGCHINSYPGNEAPITVVGYNGIRLEDMDVYTYGNGLIACDGCTGIAINDTDLVWQNSTSGNSIFLNGVVGACGGLTLNGFRDHTTNATGAVVVMQTNNIYGVDIVDAKKFALGKPWINNVTNTNWNRVFVSKELEFGVSSGDAKLLITTMASPTGAINVSSAVGDTVTLSTAGNINAITGRYHTEITFVCDVVGQSFTHNVNLLLSRSASVTSTVAGAAITFRYLGGGVYREISRTPAF